MRGKFPTCATVTPLCWWTTPSTFGEAGMTRRERAMCCMPSTSVSFKKDNFSKTVLLKSYIMEQYDLKCLDSLRNEGNSVLSFMSHFTMISVELEVTGDFLQPCVCQCV